MRSRFWSLLLAAWLFAGGPALATITHVGTDNTAQGAGASSVSVVAGQAPTSGNVVVVHFVMSASASIHASGPAGWTCSNVASSISFASCYEVAGSGGTSTLGTFTFSGATNYCYMTAEFSGVYTASPVASSAAGVYSSGGTGVSVTFASPSASPALVSGWAFNSGTSVTLSITGQTGWTVTRTVNNAGSTCPTVASYVSPVNITASGGYTAQFSGSAVGTGAGEIELASVAPSSVEDPSFMGIWLRSRFQNLLDGTY